MQSSVHHSKFAALLMVEFVTQWTVYRLLYD